MSSGSTGSSERDRDRKSDSPKETLIIERSSGSRKETNKVRKCISEHGKTLSAGAASVWWNGEVVPKHSQNDSMGKGFPSGKVDESEVC